MPADRQPERGTGSRAGEPQQPAPIPISKVVFAPDPAEQPGQAGQRDDLGPLAQRRRRRGPAPGQAELLVVGRHRLIDERRRQATPNDVTSRTTIDGVLRSGPTAAEPTAPAPAIARGGVSGKNSAKTARAAEQAAATQNAS